MTISDDKHTKNGKNIHKTATIKVNIAMDMFHNNFLTGIHINVYIFSF